MNELNIIKKNGVLYTDSREAAAVIGMEHKELNRSIRGYCEIIAKLKKPGVISGDFFVQGSFLGTSGRIKSRFLITKTGCELIATGLNGDKSASFSAVYIAAFDNARNAETEAQTEKNTLFANVNTAVRNVLKGMAYAMAFPADIMNFLRGTYAAYGIKVAERIEDAIEYYTATEIASLLGVYSESGRPHGHAVASIISRLPKASEHAVVIPYGLVGVMVRYDGVIVEAAREWLKSNGFPHSIPHNDFDYHIFYRRKSEIETQDDTADNDDDGGKYDEYSDIINLISSLISR